jgi:hypothetical protein
MIVATLCQSCGIPLDNQQLKGTEANGLKRMIIVILLRCRVICQTKYDIYRYEGNGRDPDE